MAASTAQKRDQRLHLRRVVLFKYISARDSQRFSCDAVLERIGSSRLMIRGWRLALVAGEYEVDGPASVNTERALPRTDEHS